MKKNTMYFMAMAMILLSTENFSMSNGLISNTNTNASSFWKRDLDRNLTGAGSRWVGTGPNGEGVATSKVTYSRIPAMIITNDNKIVTMFDLRWNSANDQTRIDPGIAISEDGGHSWESRTAWNTEGTDNNRRTMDATLLYDHINDEIYVMHGVWKKNADQWAQKANKNYNNDSWAAQIRKSTDGGKTWTLLKEFSRTQNTEVFSNTIKDFSRRKPTIGFLGGVGSGVTLDDGTLIFPIQTVHKPQYGEGNGGIGATIMYSRDRGETWTMGTGVVAPNQSSLENMVFKLGNKIVLTGRGNDRWAYYTEDMGQTWTRYDALNGFSGTTAAPSEGSSIYVTLPNGRQVLLVSKPDGKIKPENGRSDEYQRGNLALWVVDANDKNNKHRLGIIRSGHGNGLGAGYSSLAYKDGELLIAYEDDSDIRIKNITDYIQAAEKKAEEWGLEDVRIVNEAKDAIKEKQATASTTQDARKATIDVAVTSMTHLDKGEKATILGEEVLATGAESVVVGSKTLVLKNGSVGIGKENVVAGEDSVVIGQVSNLGNGSNKAVLIGNNNDATGNNIVILGADNKANGNDVYIMGSGVDASGVTDAIVLGKDSTATQGALSIGKEGAERKIVNVADGEISATSKEAVNGSQLFKVSGGQIRDIQENRSRIEKNTRDIHELGEKVNRTGAMGAALSGLHPASYDPLNPSQITASMGAYGDKQAVAIGASHNFTENLSVSTGIAVSPESRHIKLMGNVGISYKFGGNKDDRRAKNALEKNDENKLSSIYMMQNELNRVNMENKELKARLERLEKAVLGK